RPRSDRRVASSREPLHILTRQALSRHGNRGTADSGSAYEHNARSRAGAASARSAVMASELRPQSPCVEVPEDAFGTVDVLVDGAFDRVGTPGREGWEGVERKQDI